MSVSHKCSRERQIVLPSSELNPTQQAQFCKTMTSQEAIINSAPVCFHKIPFFYLAPGDFIISEGSWWYHVLWTSFLWCSPWRYYFLWLSPPRKILLILLMRTSISHSFLFSLGDLWFQFSFPKTETMFCSFFVTNFPPTLVKNQRKRRIEKKSFTRSWWTDAW